jgi:hypothetical protein
MGTVRTGEPYTMPPACTLPSSACSCVLGSSTGLSQALRFEVCSVSRRINHDKAVDRSEREALPPHRQTDFSGLRCQIILMVLAEI